MRIFFWIFYSIWFRMLIMHLNPKKTFFCRRACMYQKIVKMVKLLYVYLKYAVFYVILQFELQLMNMHTKLLFETTDKLCVFVSIIFHISTLLSRK